MITMRAHYVGSLRCEATHLKSGNTVVTDAPTDNHGKGEAFSPTDLLCTSLACCMISILGITAAAKNFELGKVEADITKIMASDPRRVSEIHITLDIEDKGYSEREREIIKNAALTCPVAKSLHPDIRQEVAFNFV